MRTPSRHLLTAFSNGSSQSRNFTRLFADSSRTDLTINKARLWSYIHHSCQWGAGEKWGTGDTDTGMSRLALSESDRRARDWFVDTTKSLGCEVTVDEMGNIFAERKGLRIGPATYAGSHLDTQPAGGRYDGILGVCAGLEMLKTLNDAHYQTEFPVGLVNWTNEEGARFPISMVSSGVWAGEIPLEKAHNLQEVGAGTQTMRQELEKIGYLGETQASFEAIPIGVYDFPRENFLQRPKFFQAHFELHIEQGPRLEASNRKIGVVEGVQAYRWHTIAVHGRGCHTGTTDYENRSDALLAAAKMILHSHRLGIKHYCLASTGLLTVEPGSTNTVPGRVKFSLDIRAKTDRQLVEFEEQLMVDFEKIARNEPVDDFNLGGTIGKNCSVDWTLDASSRAIEFDETCIRCVHQSSEDMLGHNSEHKTQVLISGAGHDSVYTSKRVPTAMIFVPCKDGVSHNPLEYCSPEDCANGAQVLLGAVLRYDQLRSERARKSIE